MAKTVITLTYKDGQESRFLDSFCGGTSYDSNSELTQLEHLKKTIKNYIVRHIKSYERREATNNVRATSDAKVDNELAITES